MPETRRYQIRGVVQGVGFRPFVFRTAESHSLGGWIRNDSDGVVLEIQGNPSQLEAFIEEVRTNAPTLARIESVALLEQRSNGEAFDGFAIQTSERSAQARTLVSPDMGVCEDCLRELFDPADRRHLYPYINCTNCGPRYTIIRGVPYDRKMTTMAAFPMCEACEGEYNDPYDRRFHAQPVACWDCGPRVWLRDSRRPEGDPADAAGETAGLLLDGAIVAVKGLGGYHLVADARNEEAVAELRRRKRREEKPFALMSASLDAAREYAQVDEVEAELLSSIARPILLLRKRRGGGIAESVAPGNRSWGVMLAYTPIHHLLLRDELDTVVATSGNVSDEPIAFEDEDALERLPEIADAFLLGNRKIFTRVDDSIARAVTLGDRTEVTPLRRARGYTPSPVKAPFRLPPLLAVGPELKNTVCLSRGEDLFLSHHIGDLKNEATRRSFEHAIESLSKLLEVQPGLIAHDLHPGYLSTAFAREQKELPTVAVQHHHAHMAACMCEHGLTDPVLGVIFDGTGYGTDGKIWGGEFLVGDYDGFERVAQLEYCRLPGGDKAVEEPFRVALSLLQQAHGSFSEVDVPVVSGRSEQERQVLGRMIEQGVNSPLTSSMGRLFDGIAALLGVRERCHYDAQAAIELEQLIEPGARADRLLDWELHRDEQPMRVDPRPLVRELAGEVERGAGSAAELSLRFHSTVLDMVLRTCLAIRERTGIATVVLSGGVFQNEFLLCGSFETLSEAGFLVHVHRQVPTNDGGVSLGQAAVAGWGAR